MAAPGVTTLALDQNQILTEFVAEFVDLQVPHGGTVQTSSTALKSCG